jgi:ABC-type bacteriocin/lantibiotic exporter with double-glycine peptidase domain
MDKVLEVAQLKKDIENFEQGIETMVSDDGGSVSGGQRARISLARCFYQK